MTEQIDRRARPPSLLGRSEMLRSLRHYMRGQSQGHHTIDRLKERGVERGSARRFSFKGRHRRQSDEHWNRFKGSVGKTSERRVHRYHLELNYSYYRSPALTFQSFTPSYYWGGGGGGGLSVRPPEQQVLQQVFLAQQPYCVMHGNLLTSGGWGGGGGGALSSDMEVDCPRSTQIPPRWVRSDYNNLRKPMFVRLAADLSGPCWPPCWL